MTSPAAETIGQPGEHSGAEPGPPPDGLPESEMTSFGLKLEPGQTSPVVEGRTNENGKITLVKMTASETIGPSGLSSESQIEPPGPSESESKIEPLELGQGTTGPPGETSVEGSPGLQSEPPGPSESESKKTRLELESETTGQSSTVDRSISRLIREKLIVTETEMAEPGELSESELEPDGSPESKKKPGTGPGQTVAALVEGSRTSGKIKIPITMTPSGLPSKSEPSAAGPESKKTPLDLGPGQISTGNGSKTTKKWVPIKITPPSSPAGPSPLEFVGTTGGQTGRIKMIKMTPPSSGSSGGRRQSGSRSRSRRKPSRFSSGPPISISGSGLDNPNLNLGLCSTKTSGRIIKLSSCTPRPKVKIEVDEDFGGYHFGKTEIALDPVIIKIENDQASQYQPHHDVKLYNKRTIDGEIKMSPFNCDGTMNMNMNMNGNPTIKSLDGSLLGTSVSCSSFSTLTSTSFESLSGAVTEGSAGEQSPVVQIRFGQRPPKYNKVDNRKKIVTRFTPLGSGLNSSSNKIVKQKSRTDVAGVGLGNNSKIRKTGYNFRNNSTFNVTPWKDKDRLLRKNALLREETNDQQIVVAKLIDKLGECENDNEKVNRLYDEKVAELKREKERHRTIEKKFQRDFRVDKKNIFEHYKSELSKVSEIYERTMIAFLKDLSLSRALPNGNGGSSIALNTDHPAFYYLKGFRDQAKEHQKQVNLNLSTPPPSLLPLLPSLPMTMAFNHHHHNINNNASLPMPMPISNPTTSTTGPSPISVIVGNGANRPDSIHARRNSSLLNSIDMELDMDESTSKSEVTNSNSTNLLKTNTNTTVLNKRPSTSKEAKNLNEGDAVVGNGKPKAD